MSTAIEALKEQLTADGFYTKNKLSTITGLPFTRVKNLLIASGFDSEQKEYNGSELLARFAIAVEYHTAGKSLEDIGQMLNVPTNGHFVPEEEILTPEELATLEGKREALITGISEQLAADVFHLVAGDSEDPDHLAQEIATKAKTALEGRFAKVRSLSKSLLINLL